jgi:protein SCO1/2
MMAKVMRFWFPGALIILCGVLVLIIWKPWGPNTSLKDFGSAPYFQLEDIEGTVVSLESTNDKVRLVYFFFSNCPDVCLPTTAMLSKLQTELKARGIFATRTAMFSITFDPIRDTKEQLQQFSANYNVDSAGWSFLRGEEDYTIQLAKDFGISVIKDNSGNFLHQNLFVLLDGKGQIRAWYDANDLDLTVEQIASEMQSLI